MAKRRANGEGSLRVRDDGRYEYTVKIGFKDDGRRKYKSFYGNSEKEAKEKARKYFEIQSSGLDPEQNYFFHEWANLWFENHKENLLGGTQESYKYTLRKLISNFGHMRLNEIKPYDVEVFLKRLKKEKQSESGISKCRSMLNQICHKAQANDLITKNPVEFADKMRQNWPEERNMCFTADEIRALMEQLPQDRMGWSIRLMLGTGMRGQEVLALKSEHIEADGSWIHIRKAVKRAKGSVYVGLPKSKDSVRDVPVPEFLRSCAVKLRASGGEYIWEMRKKGSPCNSKTFIEMFKKYVSQVPRVEVLTPHACRHSYVSHMQALGVDLATIQSMVGHADVDMTKKYLTVQDNKKQEAISLFNNAFSVQNKAEEESESSCRIITFSSIRK